MPRAHLFEILDHPACPGFIRDGCTDYLRFIQRIGNAYGPVVVPLARALRAHDVQHVVDLCSGGGGPWPFLRQALIAAGAPANFTVRLTDRFPNQAAFAAAHALDPMVTGEVRPVSVDEVPADMRGFRTLFSSFHHFQPDAAQRILRDATERGDGIAICEITSRDPRAFLLIAVSPLMVWLATPLLRPFSFARLFWTYVVPVIPFIVGFDGIVSCLRTYSPRELRELVATLGEAGFDWEIGLARGRGPLPVTYAIGSPCRVRDESGPAGRSLRLDATGP